MFATPCLLSTKNITEKNISLIEDAFKSVFSDTFTGHPSLSKSIGIKASDSINKKKSLSKPHLDTSLSHSGNLTAKICCEIENNFSHCISHLGNTVFEVDSPHLRRRSERRAPEFDENGKLKRVRRRPDELVGEKNHTCPYLNCGKNYTSKCSLYLHIKRNHKEADELKEGEVAPIRINSKVKKGVDIYKVFKRAQAIKYEYGADLDYEQTLFLEDEEKSRQEMKKEVSEEEDEEEIIDFSSNLKLIVESSDYRKNSHSELLTQCQTEHKSSGCLTTSNLDLIENHFNLRNGCAENEIFSWCETAEEESRKVSFNSIIIEESMQNFLSERDISLNNSQAYEIPTIGIEFNTEQQLEGISTEEEYDNVSFNHECEMSYDEEDVAFNKMHFQNLKESDFLDLSEDCKSEARVFDFEFEFGMQEVRKTLVI